MPPQYLTQPEKSDSVLALYGDAIEEIPEAAVELAKEAWNHKAETAIHAAKTIGISYLTGTALGYVLPSKGPAGWIAAGIFTVPMVVGGVKKLIDAKTEAEKEGADRERIAHNLARDVVSGGADLALNFAGGMAGAHTGHRLATGTGRIGSFGQSAQRRVIDAENRLLLTIKNSSFGQKAAEPHINPKLPTGKIQTVESEAGLGSVGVVPEKSALRPEDLSWHKRPIARVMRRIDQYEAVNQPLSRRLGNTDEYTLVEGSLHIHTKYSDGMGTVKELAAKAEAGGQKVIGFTDHNHRASRDGVKPGDPRIPEHDGTPNIADEPKWYAEQFAEAAEINKKGNIVVLVGTEMGTIGKPGTGGHHGGKNHFLMYEMPQFFEAVRRPRTLFETLSNPFRRMLGMKEIPEIKPPEVIKYNDGDMKGMITHIKTNNLKDTTGQDPIFTMAHPRWAQDHAPGLPKGTAGGDYGRYSYKTKSEWVEETDRYFRMIEVIKGQALNPKPVPEVGTRDIDLLSFRGYLNEGFHVSPVVGRDAHYGNPLGNPAETGILVKSLDKPGVLEAMRQRRTMASTNMEKLKGTAIANDRFQMGSILDQASVPNLRLKTRLESEVTPDAEYTFKLWGDRKIGDRTMAEVMQETTVSGKDLVRQGKEFSFEEVQHTLGNKGAYFVEVVRKDPLSGHNDHMYLSPFWIEPLSGGGKHGFFTPWVVSTTTNWFLSPSAPAG
ncbi:MAG TPA: PHP domain-containing protein [Candidatus Obscuribacterales bacterium]